MKPFPYDHIAGEHIVENWPAIGRKSWALVSDDKLPRWIPSYIEYDDEGQDGDTYQLEWLPLPGSQHLFLSCPAFEALLHGNRGGGKTAALIFDFARDVGRGFGESWQGILCRQSYKGFDEAAQEIEGLITAFFPTTAKFHRSKGSYYCEWQTGERLYLRALNDQRDFQTNIRGRNISWLGLDEAHLWPDDTLYTQCLTVLRSTNPGVPKRARLACNPARRGHWLDKRYRITQGLDGQPHGQEGLEKVAIRSDLFENFLLLTADPNYPQSLLDSSPTREQIASNLLGEWSVGSDGLFTDVWSDATHVVPPIFLEALSPGWRIFRAYDHGSSSPFACLWIGVSDGTDVVFQDGSRMRTVRGDLVVLSEWYGCRDGRQNVGLRLTVREIAEGIVAREKIMGGGIDAGPADASIFTDDHDRGSQSIADLFEDAGVVFDKSSKGSRSAGYDLIRSAMAGSYKDDDGRREHPGLFIASNCPWTLKLVPSAPRDERKPDDTPASYPDHILDALRYAVVDASSGTMWGRGWG